MSITLVSRKKRGGNSTHVLVEHHRRDTVIDNAETVDAVHSKTRIDNALVLPRTHSDGAALVSGRDGRRADVAARNKGISASSMEGGEVETYSSISSPGMNSPSLGP